MHLPLRRCCCCSAALYNLPCMRPLTAWPPLTTFWHNSCSMPFHEVLPAMLACNARAQPGGIWCGCAIAANRNSGCEQSPKSPSCEQSQSNSSPNSARDKQMERFGQSVRTIHISRSACDLAAASCLHCTRFTPTHAIPAHPPLAHPRQDSQVPSLKSHHLSRQP